jgi:hypothetical protein
MSIASSWRLPRRSRVAAQARQPLMPCRMLGRIVVLASVRLIDRIHDLFLGRYLPAPARRCPTASCAAVRSPPSPARDPDGPCTPPYNCSAMDDQHALVASRVQHAVHPRRPSLPPAAPRSSSDANPTHRRR